MYQKIKSTPTISDTIAIGLITIIAYLSVLFYEMGVCSFFNIPIYFIEISLTNTLFIAGLMAMLLLTGYGYSNIVMHILKAHFKIEGKQMISFLSNGLIWILLSSLVFTVLDKYLIFPFSIIIAAILSFVITYLFYWQIGFTKRQYEKKFPGQISPIRKSERIFNRFGLNFIGLMLCSIIPLCTFMIGYYSNMRSGYYLASGNNNKTIIIKKYEHNLIGITYDAKKNELGDSLIVINSDVQLIKFKIELFEGFKHKVVVEIKKQ